MKTLKKQGFLRAEEATAAASIFTMVKKEELCKIAKVLGGKYISYFSFPGGVLIGDIGNNRKRKKVAETLVFPMTFRYPEN